MAKPNGVEKMSYSELVALRSRIDKLMVEKQASARAELREKMASMATQQGLSLEQVIGKRGRSKGPIAVKYRDPNNLENTWTGRGRMPRWMVAATKGGRAKKEDFLI
jgi:DNA-binding protein H-NS